MPFDAPVVLNVDHVIVAGAPIGFGLNVNGESLPSVIGFVGSPQSVNALEVT
jgi:hypothetical protein